VGPLSFSWTQDAAGFQAIANLIGVSHPIMLSLGNFLVPAVAGRAKQGLLAARSGCTQSVQPGRITALAFDTPAAVYTRLLLGLFMAASPYVVLEGPLRLLALTYVLTFWTMAIRYF
jgi:hypothetical protein